MLTPAFTAAQNPLYPNEVIVTDTSSGSDSDITQRRVYVQDYAGNYLVPSGTTTDYVEWPLADSSITLDILTEDTAVSILVEWLDVSDVVVEELEETFCLAMYNQQFLYELVQLLGLTPSIPQDTNYSSNLANLWTAVRSAILAIEIGNDISASQASLNRATNLRINQSLYF